MARSQTSSDSSVTAVSRERKSLSVKAALLWSTSRRPKAATAAATMATTADSCERSVCTPTARPPAALISAATRSAPSPLMSTTATAAPSRPSLRAVAPPMPPAPPVTMATLSCSRPMARSSHCRRSAGDSGSWLLRRAQSLEKSHHEAPGLRAFFFGVGGRSHGQSGFTRRSEKHSGGEIVRRDVNETVLSQALEARLDEAQEVILLELLPTGPAQSGRSLFQRDAPEVGLATLGQEGIDSRPHDVPRIGDAGHADDHLGQQPLLHHDERRLEELRFVGEVVVDGALGDPGRLGDGIDAGLGESVNGEPLDRRRHDGRSSRLGIFLPATLDSHGPLLYID